ncbi:MAG: arginine--tRNA ligase [Bacteroidia bacterium]|jgi:arginyl-tRNA synthetase|nr:arginine--tRNA ligase [Bacteroidia bacterium]
MMIEKYFKQQIAQALQALYTIAIDEDAIAIEKTNSDFNGDYTFVVFPYVKKAAKAPDMVAKEIGEYLLVNANLTDSYNVIKGFLNINIKQQFWIDFLAQQAFNDTFGLKATQPNNRVLVEYSSPNTNKPLHLGHIRNNLLGYAVAEILKANGYAVFTCNLINDRGIHICKSMYAWMKFGNGETPQSSGIKGDHLVGKYYVLFNTAFTAEVDSLMQNGLSKEDAEKQAPSILAAQELLRKWEAGDVEVMRVWKMMNEWVYDGFDYTYRNLGVSFDKYYYESNTYLLGKEIVTEGLQKEVFYQKADGSVWVDLTDDGLDHKLVLRTDGTSVYITQDMGTADLKYDDFNCNKSIYVVGNEQDYHFKVLQLILQKLGRPYAPEIYHLSYGMVELPDGKMKSREGTVVDADDLIAGMVSEAERITNELGKTEGLQTDELNALYNMVGLGALKYFILKVDPKKKMLFNPEESIDFHGNTGPFIQYTHARIKSILRNAPSIHMQSSLTVEQVNPDEVEIGLIKSLYQFSNIIEEAANTYSPGVLCNYLYEVAKQFNHFYHEHSVLKETNLDKQTLRLQLCSLTAHVIKTSCALLGINVPERM